VADGVIPAFGVSVPLRIGPVVFGTANAPFLFDTFPITLFAIEECCDCLTQCGMVGLIALGVIERGVDGVSLMTGRFKGDESLRDCGDVCCLFEGGSSLF
jgi:hypothetical protein